jgi:hypothetical protein
VVESELAAWLLDCSVGDFLGKNLEKASCLRVSRKVMRVKILNVARTEQKVSRLAVGSLIDAM